MMSRNRKGISLIEVVVAVTLLAMMATVHTVVTLRYAVRNRVAAVGVDRATAISTAVDLYATMPFASLPASGSSACTTVTALVNYRHQRCVSVTSPTQAIDRSLPPTGSIFS
jgi:type II secretory pathway pseudopilin PulG